MSFFFSLVALTMISFGLEPCVAEPLIAQMSSCSGNVWTFWLLLAAGNWAVSWLNSGQNSQDLVLQRVFPCASARPTLVTLWEGVVAGRHTPPHTHPHTPTPTHPPPHTPTHTHPHTHPHTHTPPHTPTHTHTSCCRAGDHVQGEGASGTSVIPALLAIFSGRKGSTILVSTLCWEQAAVRTYRARNRSRQDLQAQQEGAATTPSWLPCRFLDHGMVAGAAEAPIRGALRKRASRRQSRQVRELQKLCQGVRHDFRPARAQVPWSPDRWPQVGLERSRAHLQPAAVHEVHGRQEPLHGSESAFQFPDLRLEENDIVRLSVEVAHLAWHLLPRTPLHLLSWTAFLLRSGKCVERPVLGSRPLPLSWTAVCKVSCSVQAVVPNDPFWEVDRCLLPT